MVAAAEAERDRGAQQPDRAGQRQPGLPPLRRVRVPGRVRPAHPDRGGDRQLQQHHSAPVRGRGGRGADAGRLARGAGRGGRHHHARPGRSPAGPLREGHGRDSPPAAAPAPARPRGGRRAALRLQAHRLRGPHHRHARDPGTDDRAAPAAGALRPAGASDPRRLAGPRDRQLPRGRAQPLPPAAPPVRGRARRVHAARLLRAGSRRERRRDRHAGLHLQRDAGPAAGAPGRAGRRASRPGGARGGADRGAGGRQPGAGSLLLLGLPRPARAAARHRRVQQGPSWPLTTASWTRRAGTTSSACAPPPSAWAS